MPTGVAIKDVRQQLFDAAERVLVRAGVSGLTSRAVTDEAGVAKGVLHRHFEDFDAFLAEFVLDRAERIGGKAAELSRSVGRGTVTENLVAGLISVFGPPATAIFSLVTSRAELRRRLREARPGGVPALTGAQSAIADYLDAEQALGRILPEADTDTVALSLLGSAHLFFASQDGSELDRARVLKIVTTLTAPIQSPSAR